MYFGCGEAGSSLFDGVEEGGFHFGKVFLAGLLGVCFHVVVGSEVAGEGECWVFGEVGAVVGVVGEVLGDDFDRICGGEFLYIAPGGASDGGWSPSWWGVLYSDGAFGGILTQLGDQ